MVFFQTHLKHKIKISKNIKYFLFNLERLDVLIVDVFSVPARAGSQSLIPEPLMLYWFI